MRYVINIVLLLILLVGATAAHAGIGNSFTTDGQNTHQAGMALESSDRVRLPTSQHSTISFPDISLDSMAILIQPQYPAFDIHVLLIQHQPLKRAFLFAFSGTSPPSV